MGVSGAAYEGREPSMAKTGPKSNVTPSRTSSQNVNSPQSTIMSVVKASYSRDKLYLDSVDNKGHYEQTHVKYPPSIEVLMRQAVDDNPGYRGSLQAWMRNAHIHQLKYEADNPGSTIDPAAVAQEIRRMDFERALMKDRGVKEDCSKLLEVAEMCVDTQDYGLLNSFIEKMQEDLANIEYSPGHIQEYEDSISEAMEMMAASRKRRR